MKVTAWMSIALALGLLSSQAATADPIARNHGVAKRQENQRDRVQLEKTYKSDGALTTKERADLQQQLNKAGPKIREEKHGQQ